MRQVVLALLVALAVVLWLGGGLFTPDRNAELAQALVDSPGGAAPVALEREEPGRTPVALDRSSTPTELEDSTSGPIEARVVDAQTGEAVPFCSISHIEWSQPLAVGADGVARGGDALPYGEVPLTFQDRGCRNKPAKLAHGPSAGELSEIAVEVGPTYVLDVELPPDVPVDELALRLHADPTRFHLAISEDPRAPLRLEGEWPWCRFEPVTERTPDYALVLESEDGSWRGEARVTTLVGIAPTPVRIELRHLGTLHVTLRDTEGAQLASRDARIEVRAEDGQVRFDHDARTGERWIGGLAEGGYSVTARSPRHRTQSAQVRVTGGATHAVSLELVALPILGPVGGTLTSATGSWHPPMSMELTSILGEDTDVPLRTPVIWTERDGRWTGEFLLDDVPRGQFLLRPDAPTWLPVEPAQIAISMPRTDLELRCDDTGALRPIGFHVQDAETGATLNGFVIRYTGETGARFELHGAQSDMQSLPDYHAGARLRWTIEKPGYAIAEGTQEDFVEPLPQGETTLYVARVSLRRED